MKKILSVILIILCFLFIPAQVQAASPKKQVTKQAKSVIKACKSYDQQALFKHLKKTKGFYYIINDTWNQYIKENKRHDKIKIKNVSVKGKNASVYIEIKTIDYYELIADCISKELKRSGPIDINRMENDIINKMAKYNSLWKKHQTECYLNIYFKKINGKWKVSKNNEAIHYLYDSGAGKVLKDFIKHPYDFYLR